MDRAEEIWKAVPSLPQYEASSLGRIRRVPYQAVMPHGGVRTYGGHEYFGTWEPVQCRFIVVFRGKTYRVHRLVCEAFRGPVPFPKAEVLHADEDSSNNKEGNLSWGTRKQNLNAPGFLARIRGEVTPQNIPVGRSKRDRGLLAAPPPGRFGYKRRSA